MIESDDIDLSYKVKDASYSNAEFTKTENIVLGYSHWEERIKELMKQTAHPDSNSVIQAMKRFCNEMMQAITHPPKDNEVSLTRDYKDTIVERVKRDPEFAEALLQETVRKSIDQSGVVILNMSLAEKVMKWLDTHCKKVSWNVDSATYEVTDTQAYQIANIKSIEPEKSSKREDGMPANAEERRLRRMLCASRHGSLAYMDDGEAQGDDIDYMRLSLDEIDSAYHRFQMKKHGFVNN